jgi:hypothetical protein
LGKEEKEIKKTIRKGGKKIKNLRGSGNRRRKKKKGHFVSFAFRATR